MAQIKGKFITLAGLLINDRPDLLMQANSIIDKKLGFNYNELAPDDFYEIELFNEFLNYYTQSFSDAKTAYSYFGSRVFSLIKRTEKIPEYLKNTKDFIKYEVELFSNNHKGNELVNHKIISEGDNFVTIYAPPLGYDDSLTVGIWIGIIEYLRITSYDIKDLGGFTYRISWE